MGIHQNDTGLRAAVCGLCKQLHMHPEGFVFDTAAYPRVELKRKLLTPEDRAAIHVRIELMELAERLAVGDNLTLVCHCRRRGKASTPATRCHGDGVREIVTELGSVSAKAVELVL